jgi:hypothetical protein
VPSKIWLAFGASPNREQIRASMHLMDSVSICGFSDMSPEQQDTFIEHVMNRDNWARASGDMMKTEAEELAPNLLIGDVAQGKTVRKTKAKAPPPHDTAAEVHHHGQVAAAAARAPAAGIKAEQALVAPASASAESALIARAATPQKRGGTFVMFVSPVINLLSYIQQQSLNPNP